MLALLIGRTSLWRLVLALCVSEVILSCGGGSPSPGGLVSTQLGVNPNRMNFGQVAIGHSESQNGSLSAGGSDINISTASWDGTGYALSGVSFPLTVRAGKTVPFTITFAPQSSSTATGQVSFFSDALNSPTVISLTGTGSQAVQHSVSLFWSPSASQVVGYNVYRRAGSAGSYVRLNTSLIAAFEFADDTVQSGNTYYYAATSVDLDNNESAYSNIATAVIP